jgi:hypothetical protein
MQFPFALKDHLGKTEEFLPPWKGKTLQKKYRLDIVFKRLSPNWNH